MPKSGVACLRTIANSGRYRKYSLHGHVLEYGIPRSMLGSQAAEVVVTTSSSQLQAVLRYTLCSDGAGRCPVVERR